ncbi:MAG: DUF995 domain-containing protein [Pseudomonadota bacterium]|nr:DUF995 domain-containing protein [Pseudomonadota bacterium]
MKLLSKSAAILATAILLDGCASMNLFKDSTPQQDAAVQQQPLPAPGMAPGASGPINAAQIKTLLTGKSWRWSSPKYAGVTLYASDGTSLVEVTGKGTTQGHWETRDGQLCESFAPAAFLPQGVPMTCQAFTSSNGHYMVGPATFQLAS